MSEMANEIPDGPEPDPDFVEPNQDQDAGIPEDWTVEEGEDR